VPPPRSITPFLSAIRRGGGRLSRIKHDWQRRIELLRVCQQLIVNVANAQSIVMGKVPVLFFSADVAQFVAISSMLQEKSCTFCAWPQLSPSLAQA
jgi:hypothetical protein